jgi:hypothetical protein
MGGEISRPDARRSEDERDTFWRWEMEYVPVVVVETEDFFNTSN